MITFRLIGPKVRKPGGKTIRFQLRRSRSSWTGRHAQSIGLRVGYWPCLGGPFVAIDFASYRIDIWYGLPSYRG